MRSSIIVGSLCAALAVASPIHKAVHKKDLVWDITTEIITITVTEGEPLPTISSSIPEVTIHTTLTSSHKAHSHVKSSSSSVVYVAPAPTTTPTTPPSAPTTSTTCTTTPTEAPVVVASTSTPVVVAADQAATSSTAAASVASPTDYQSTAIYHHAKHRANHSASALEWDDTLATYALATANTCVFAHDMTEGVGGYGQNLAAYGTSGDVSSLDKSTLVADAITNQWYYGEAANVPYGQDSPATSNVPEFLHFTAVVWEATTKVGCATVECAAGTIFSYASLYTVCDYSSEGNVLGTFIANVAEPIGLPGITATIS